MGPVSPPGFPAPPSNAKREVEGKITETDTATTSQQKWSALCSHLNQWFYQPDLEALAITLSAARAHWYSQSGAVGLFIVGPSGSGKTAIHVRALLSLPETHLIGDLSPKAFISLRTNSPGLLKRIGKSGILVAKDFTTLLSKREVDRAEIISQVREIMDGEYRRDTGADGMGWSGKVSMIAACTPALERAWAVHRDLGERFVTVRLGPSDNPISSARLAQGQNGHQDEIQKGIQQYTTALFGRPPVIRPESVPEPWQTRIFHLSAMVATLRAHVIRVQNEIVDIPSREDPTRLSPAFTLISRAHADLIAAGDYCECSYQIAKRLAWDSIPLVRVRIVRSIPRFGNITAVEISKMTNLPLSTVRWNLQELEAVGAVRYEPSGLSETEFKPEFLANFEAADSP